jgi:hypothetical protein
MEEQRSESVLHLKLFVLLVESEDHLHVHLAQVVGSSTSACSHGLLSLSALSALSGLLSLSGLPSLSGLLSLSGLSGLSGLFVLGSLLGVESSAISFENCINSFL